MTHSYSVWAPVPAKVELQIGPERVPMTPPADGWWMVTPPPLDAAKGELDYGFVLDGEGPFPDPRSGWQPNGVHGLSRLVDHGDFPWTDAGWRPPPLSSAIIYELHTGTFTQEGTFDAIVEKLDHLAALGVTHLEIMPVNEFPGDRNWGYDGVDLFAPHHAYGGPQGLKRLVDACHARNLAVLLDVVYNHLGPTGNYLGKFAPYFTSRFSSPWGPGINWDDAHCAEVRRFFCDNALMWLRDYHFDGLRLDAVHAILDFSATPFLEQLAVEVKRLEAQLGRHLVLIAESDLNDPRVLWSRDRGGFGLDAQWNDDFHHALHTILTGESQGYCGDFGSFADLAKAMRNAFVYDGRYSRFRRRPHGRPPTGLSGHRFLGYSQNHDQTGNRAGGERSSHLMTPARLKIAAALVLTSPFVPLLFQGEEWGATTPFFFFTDHADPELGRAVGEGRRRELAAMGFKLESMPDPQSPEAFERSKLDWSELWQPSRADLMEWHHQLIKLRRGEPSLTDGRLDCLRVRYARSERWLAVERGSILVACNLDDCPRTIPLPAGNHHVLLASAPETRLEKRTVTLQPDSVVLLKRQARNECFHPFESGRRISSLPFVA